MSEKQVVDRRILRTKEAIRNALIGLIEEKGFETLTVADITTRANINRGTFYLHYQDKYDLLEKTVTEIIRGFKEIVLQAAPFKLSDFYNTGDPVTVMVSFFEYLKVHATMLHAVLGIKGNISFQAQMRKAIESNIFNVGFFADINLKKLLVPSEYLISYVSSAHLGVIQAWLEKGCLESPKEMASILSQLLFRGPVAASGIS